MRCVKCKRYLLSADENVSTVPDMAVCEECAEQMMPSDWDELEEEADEIDKLCRKLFGW